MSRASRALLPIAILAAMGEIGCGGSSLTQMPPPPPPNDEFTTTTSQQGSILILRNQTNTDTIQIGIETGWGGSIVEVSVNGTNYVNAHDTGREVQPASYDGNAHYDACAACTGSWGWNPVLGGDEYDQGTPTITQTMTAGSLYTKAQSLQWNPDAFGGGLGAPVVGDIIVEQTITPVQGHSHAFQAHYKITHLGSDLHADAQQEFPAVYTNADYNQFVYYGGTDPWTNGTVSTSQFQQLGQPGSIYYVPEHWGAHVNSQGDGLTVFVPSQYPYVAGFDFPGPAGPAGNGTNYFAPFAMQTIWPNFVFEGDVFLIAGDYKTARGIVYELHQAVSAPDIFTPFGSIDAPAAETTISGITQVTGWALDDQIVSKVEVLVDGSTAGTASYGSSRPDVPSVYPYASANVGYSYSLDTTKYPNGSHVLNVKATDSSGNVALFPNVVLTVGN